MRGTHDIAVQAFAKNVRVLPLHTRGHGLPDKGKGLVTVEPTEFDHLAVQRESVICKYCFPESDAPRIFINESPVSKQLHVDSVEVGMIEIPKLHTAQSGDIDGVASGVLQ